MAEWLRLSDNDLTGTIPSNLGQMTSLTCEYVLVHTKLVHGWNVDFIDRV